ncbi:MAG: GtrA family protein [Brevinematales bacterium]|nr:GtrA family protein [Brevinematales bacterium]
MLIKNEIKEFFVHGIKFGLVGVMNTFVGWASFALFFYVFKIDFKVSNILSYILGVMNSFIFNKLWTFKSHGFKYKEIFLFLVVFLISFAIQYVVSVLLKYQFKIDPFISYLVGNIVYTLVNFLGNKFLTFNES